MARQIAILMAAVLAGLLLPPLSMAQVSELQSYSFVLNAPDDEMVEWDAPDLTGANTVHLKLNFTRAGVGKTYFPDLLIQVGSERLYATLEMAVSPTGRMPTMVTLFDEGDKLTFSRLERYPSFGQPFELRVAWTHDGLISFQYLDSSGTVVDSRQFNLEAPVDDFGIAVSTGSVTVERLTLLHDKAID